VRYHVNVHFANVAAVARFTDFCARTAVAQRPNYVLIETGLAYSALDIVGRCLGSVAPFRSGTFFGWPEALLDSAATSLPPYNHLPCVVGGVPTLMVLQGHYRSQNPDDNFSLLHRISVMFPSGTVTLTNTHGPVLWHRAYCVPEYEATSDEPDLDVRSQSVAAHTGPTSVVLTPADGDGWGDIVTEQWPRAAGEALRQLEHAARTGVDPAHQTVEYLAALSGAWHDVMRATGGPAAVEDVDTPEPPVDPFRYADDLLRSDAR
jgi:thiazolinyl imide reductase